MTVPANTPNSQSVEVVRSLFSVPVVLHKNKETGIPHILAGRIVCQGQDDFRFDLRLFLQRKYIKDSGKGPRLKVRLTATDRGIRFTEEDLVEACGRLSDESLTFAEALQGILHEPSWKFITSLSTDRSALVMGLHSSVLSTIYQDDYNPEDIEHADFRKYFIHHDTQEVTPTRRGFKLTHLDVGRLIDVETQHGCLIKYALRALRECRDRHMTPRSLGTQTSSINPLDTSERLC